jgi:hypothetical protein
MVSAMSDIPHFTTKEAWKAYWIADEEKRYKIKVDEMRQATSGLWWFISGRLAYSHPGGGLAITYADNQEWLLPENEKWRRADR